MEEKIKGFAFYAREWDTLHSRKSERPYPIRVLMLVSAK